MADLFVKRRKADGSLSDPVPAFGDGKTAEQRLAESEAMNEQLQKQLEQTNTDLMAFMEIVLTGGL